ncbi:hypothetical protein B0H16DRAFT_1559759 [Mycena metata]|uniref:Thiaminase-2/PQQC domain-containing protein n=1 Tax=Mycena metata TaxID=1033252 RepID=A0AAD7N3D9_9AGAR|nr:hypothetical protein B0H16DRAFT_1559759 [Mycena metata]
MPPEDEPISIAAAALAEAEADAAAPNSKLVFDPECRLGRVRSWASIARNQPPLQHNQPLPTPSAYAPESPSSTATMPTSPSSGHTLPPQPQIQGAVAELLEKNQDVFDRVLNHPFPQAFGKGSASLDGFRHYMIANWLYLKTCTQLKFLALGTAAYGEEVEGFDVRYKVEYSNKLAEICGTMLGITKSAMEATMPSTELDTTEQFYRKALQSDKAWLGYYVVLLPCVLIYFKIAERLMKDPSTYAPNLLYPLSWLTKQQPEFINKNIALNGGVKDWNWMFRIACERELEIFNTGLHAPTPFQIIPDGIHSIHISSSKGVRLVLAVHNVTDVRPPLDRYLPRNARSCIVGMKPTGGDNEKWHVLATNTGYTFKNLGTGLYLGISTAPPHGEYRVLQAVPDPYCWWINPSLIQPDQGPSLYQIYDSVNLRYTLHAAIEALNGTGPFTPIIAHENSEAPCQMWSFDNYRFKPYERKQRTPDKDSEQSPKAQATTSEMKKLMDKHSREMEEMEEVIAAKDWAWRVEVAERFKIQDQMRILGGRAEWERRKHQEELHSLRNALLAAEEEAEVSGRRYRELLRRMRAPVCHWESFSGTFRRAAFNPAPIEFDVQNFIFRYNIDSCPGTTSFSRMQDGRTWLHSTIEFCNLKVLVGDPSHLLWVTCHGRFEVKSLLPKNPVPGLDKDIDIDSDTWFIARYSHSGTLLVNRVKDGEDSMHFRQHYEVLCYRDL